MTSSAPNGADAVDAPRARHRRDVRKVRGSRRPHVCSDPAAGHHADEVAALRCVRWIETKTRTTSHFYQMSTRRGRIRRRGAVGQRTPLAS
jgi:hypothetical protein